MSRSNLVSRKIGHLLVFISVLAGASPASAGFYLDLSAVDDDQIQLMLGLDAPISSAESIDIKLAYDPSALELDGTPTFEAVLTGPDFDEFAACAVSGLPNNWALSSCSGIFQPKRVPLESGRLLSWRFYLLTDPPSTTLSVSVMVDEGDPVLLATPIPEPGTPALILAGIGLLAHWTMRQRDRLR